MSTTNFDVTDFFKSPIDEGVTSVVRGTTEFKFRRLNGEEALKYNDLPTLYDKVRFVLARALLSGANNVPIGDENAAKLIQRNGMLAELLFNDIFDFTQTCVENEKNIWDEAKKNSGVTASSKSSKGNSADDTGLTQEDRSRIKT